MVASLQWIVNPPSIQGLVASLGTVCFSSEGVQFDHHFDHEVFLYIREFKTQGQTTDFP